MMASRGSKRSVAEELQLSIGDCDTKEADTADSIECLCLALGA